MNINENLEMIVKIEQITNEIENFGNHRKRSKK